MNIYWALGTFQRVASVYTIGVKPWLKRCWHNSIMFSSKFFVLFEGIGWNIHNPRNIGEDQRKSISAINDNSYSLLLFFPLTSMPIGNNNTSKCGLSKSQIKPKVGNPNFFWTNLGTPSIFLYFIMLQLITLLILRN